MATIDSSGQNLSDEQNLLNEVHLVIAFIVNPTWIKERKEGSYLLQSACKQCVSSTLRNKNSQVSSARPTSGGRRPTAVTSRWSTDEADPYSLSGPALSRLSVTVRVPESDSSLARS